MKGYYFLYEANHSVKSGLIGLLFFGCLAPVFSQTTQTFITSGIFTVPANVTTVTVECWGAGGAGGGSGGGGGFGGGGGGGGGAYSRSDIVVTPGLNYTVTVGVGGFGNPSNGAIGGDSWFNTISTILAAGGNGGTAANLGNFGAAPRPSGQSIGSIIFTGGGGGGGSISFGGGGGGGSSAGRTISGNFGAPGTPGAGGPGGVAPPNGGAGGNGNYPGFGFPGFSPGGGGGGAGNSSSTPGGNGANGQVIITFTAPTISSFTPTSAGSGTTVAITGTNFTGATAVSFGGTPATSFTVVSATSITAVVALGTSGNVVVTIPGATATLAGFTFIPAPTITTFTPTSAASGTTVTLTGTNFTGATAVSFGGTAATSFTVVSATSITAVVASGASGNVSVTTAGGTATSPGFTFIPAPTITTFTPTSAASGATVTITGTNFTGATAVSFGGTAATSFTVVSATSITALVASGTSGTVSVTTPGGTATSPGFTFIFPVPTISSFNPTSGVVGTTVTISGTNFSATAVNNIVYFGATKATVTAATATQLTVAVPTGATYQPISVTVNGLTAYSSAPFIVTFPGNGGIDVNSFAAKVDFTTGTQPYGVTIGDIDGDGKPDLAVSNAGGGSVSVFRNTSTSGSITVGSFALKVDFANANPNDVAFGDVDGDGKPDMVVANYASNTVSVFRNISASGSIAASSFAAKVDFATGTNPSSVAIGDLDGDGKSDMVTSNGNGNTVSLFRNTSTSGSITTGSFALKVDLAFTSGTSPWNVAIGDVDGDGKADLVIANTGNGTISVLRNISISGSITASSFASKVDFPTGTNAGGVKISDVDKDGKPDLVALNQGIGTVSVLRNTSTSGSITSGSFASKIDFSTGTQPYFVSVGDLDGDSKPDFIVGNAGSNSVSVFRNTSVSGFITSSSFAPKVDFTTGTSPQGVAIGDVDGDGKPDLVVSNNGAGTLSVLRNQIGGPTITPTITSFTPTSAGTGTTVTITGTNLTGATAVSFGGTAATSFTVVSATSITAVVASGTTGNVSVTTPGGTVTSPGFTFIPAPTISSFTPTSAASGATVSITGTNFTGATAVSFGGTAATSFAVVSATSITAVVGSGTSGNVSVTTPGGTVTSPGFTFIPAPTISSFTPTSAANGATVTITGTNFTGATAVSFGGTPATSFTVVSATSISAVVASGTTGYVSVTTPGGTATSPGFTFIPAPTITTFTPTSAASGATVTLTGTNFTGATAVSFGGTAATSFTVVSATSITAVVASGTTGSVSVTTPGGTATSIGFTFIPAPTITSFTPTSAVSGATVTITGTNLTGATAVSFGGTAATSFTVVSATSITAVVASGTTGSVTVTTPGGTVTSTGFTFIPTPTISSFTPNSGVIGASVTITGTNFSTSAASNIVKFNGTAATITGTPTATSITTSVPTGATTGKITVAIGGLTATSTLDFTVVLITNESFVNTYDRGATLTVSITVNDPSKVSAVNFKSRGISEVASAVKSVAVTASGNKFEKVVAAADLTDPIGLVYSFEAIDLSAGVVNSTTGKAYVKYLASSTDQVLPALSFGNQVSDYQIIAVPLDLTNKSVSSVFASLMPYDKTKWRLFDYASNDNREYSAFSTIDAGKGYWLIVKTNTTINPGEGKSVQADDAAPFAINLSTGWNLIGNPYNFRVSWTDVLAANSNPAGVDAKLKVFSGGTLTDGTILEKYRGAFVFSNNAVSIKIPVTRNISLGGRMKKEEMGIVNSLDQNHWEVKLTLKNGPLSNELGGISMHPKATLKGKDPFDEVSVPLPEGLNLFELAYPHPEVFTYFNKDVVPTQDNFRWDFEVKRSTPAGNLELSWKNDYFGDNEKQLFLFDPTTLQITDMRKVNHITLTTATNNLSVLYGGPEYIQHALDSDLPWLGYPYPNPAKEELTIPFRVPERHDQMPVKISIHNGTGVEVATPVNRTLGKGNYDVKWYPQGESGLYLIRMRIGLDETKIMKVIIK